MYAPSPPPFPPRESGMIEFLSNSNYPMTRNASRNTSLPLAGREKGSEEE